MILPRRGVALVQVLLFAVVTSIFLVTGIQFVAQSFKAGRGGRVDGQAYHVALAGINHAISWLLKQTPQPVTVFDPRATTDPDEEAETTEEQLGLVHEFAVDAARNLWGRYEVGRASDPANPAPARDGLLAGAHATALYPEPPGITWTAEDVGRQRGQEAGMVLRVRSRGYVYDRTGGVTFATAPRKTRVTLEAEVHRTTLGYREAALYSYWASTAGESVKLEAEEDLELKVQVADGAGRGYWTNTAEVTEDGDVDWGAPAPTNLKDQDDPAAATYVDPDQAAQLRHVFGASDLAGVEALADVVASDAGAIPQPMPANQVIYVKGDVSFDGTPQLDGSGVLFVDGDLTIDGGTTEQRWDGLIFATGKYTQKNRSTITGGVIAGKKVWLKGDDDGKTCVLRFSKATLDQVAALVGTYRLEHATLRVLDDLASPTPY